MTTWREGDPDPTEGAREWGGPTCYAVSTADDSLRVCTWPLGHMHPQHIAGGLRGFITEVWPVDRVSADAASPLAPAEHVAEMLALKADMHWRDAHPNTNVSPAARLVAYLDHETATCRTCRGTGRVAAAGTGHLPSGHPNTDDTACPTCDGA